MSETKTCSRCGIERTYEHFEKTSRRQVINPDGYQGVCKVCRYADAAIRRNKPSYQERIRAAHIRYRKTNTSRARAMRGFVAYKKKHPERVRVTRLVRSAIERGQLIKPEFCEHCGGEPSPNAAGASGLQGHHQDYSKPLDVVWLCGKCHAAEHWGMT